MKQWEIWKFPYPTAERSHWFVIVSPTVWCDQVGNEVVNGLLCTTLRPPGRVPRPHEVRLDVADGFDWDTVVKFSHVHELPKSRATEKLGQVAPTRQRAIIRVLATRLELG
jgi:mRNA-degrading endonuclease toxin of MazEF toxin-antitoxin module